MKKKGSFRMYFETSFFQCVWYISNSNCIERYTVLPLDRIYRKKTGDLYYEEFKLSGKFRQIFHT